MKKILLEDLCIVVLEKPYNSLVNADARETFANLINTKVRGYISYHGHGVLPFDTTDFLGTHLIISNKNNPFGEIYMSYKSISYKECDNYNLPFPFLTILKNNSNPECYEEMSKILKGCRDRDEDLSYDTGWTINPDIKGDKELQSILKEMVATFVCNHHPEHKIPHWVTLGICKVKTDQMFLNMGLSEISASPIFPHPYLLHTDCRAVISMNNMYSDWVYASAKKYQTLWDNRITLGQYKILDLKKAS